MAILKDIYLILYHVFANNFPWYFKYFKGNKFRNYLFRKITKCGRNVSIGRCSNIMNITKLLKTGNNVSIGENFRLIGFSKPVIMGNNILIGFDNVMMTSEHKYDNRNKDIRKQKYKNESIIIEDDVYTGGRVYIMKGVTVGKGSYIGAGSVVTKSVPPNSVVWGVPARVVKKISQEEPK